MPCIFCDSTKFRRYTSDAAPKFGPAVERRVKLFCSFCGKSEDDIPSLIKGPKVNICSPCIALCVEVLGDRKNVLQRRATDKKAGA